MTTNLHPRLSCFLLGTAALIPFGTECFAQTGSAAPTPGTTSLQEIVVTAERRTENIQKTPIAITAISGATLAAAGVTDVSGLNTLVPSVHVSVNQTGTAIQIRGFSTENPNPQGDPSLSFNVDDIYYPRTQATGGVFFDVNRLEVLRGPQGTTYGRNAVTGVVNVITNNPVDRYAAEAALEVGSYGLVNSFGMVNLPVTDQLYTRLAFDTLNHNGYIGNHFDDADDFGQRFKALYRPNDEFSALFTESYYHKGGHGTADVLFPYVNDSNPWQDTFYPPDYGKMNRSDTTLAGRFEWNPGLVTFTYLPSFQNFSENNHSGQLGALSHDILKSKSYSQELRVSSNNNENKAGTLQWIAGLFWFKEDQSYTLNIVQPFKPLTDAPPYLITDFGDWPSITDQSEAAYGQATYSVLDWLRVVGGLRYTRDKKSQNGIEDVVIFGHAVNSVAIGGPTSSNVSYKAMIEADVTPTAMVYGGVTTGYHAGGEFDGQSPGNIYGPETLTDYETGIKSRWLDNRLQANLDAYYYDYNNLQVGATIPPFTIATTNAKLARVEGTEFDADYLLTADDKFTVSLDYEFAQFINYILPSRFSSNGGGTPVPGGVSFDGEVFSGIPRWSGNVGYQHVFLLPNGATVTAGVSSYLRADTWASTTHTPVNHLAGYSNTGANVLYTSADAKWSVNAYVHNLENKPDPTAVGNAAGPQLYASLSPPRTAGVRFDVKF